MFFDHRWSWLITGLTAEWLELEREYPVYGVAVDARTASRLMSPGA
jgi:hypothetical protein